MLSLTLYVEAVVPENDCTTICADMAQALDNVFDSYATVINKMTLTMVKEEEDNEDHA